MYLVYKYYQSSSYAEPSIIGFSRNEEEAIELCLSRVRWVDNEFRGDIKIATSSTSINEGCYVIKNLKWSCWNKEKDDLAFGYIDASSYKTDVFIEFNRGIFVNFTLNKDFLGPFKEFEEPSYFLDEVLYQKEYKQIFLHKGNWNYLYEFMKKNTSLYSTLKEVLYDTPNDIIELILKEVYHKEYLFELFYDEDYDFLQRNDWNQIFICGCV